MAFAHFDLAQEAIAAGRAELPRLHPADDIDERMLRELERDLDLEELSLLFRQVGTWHER